MQVVGVDLGHGFKGELAMGLGNPHARPGERLSRVPLGKETQWARQRFLIGKAQRHSRLEVSDHRRLGSGD
jgi:hypothetical protein